MPIKLLRIVLIIAIPAACSNIDGLYVPACIAFEGDEIELSGGRYEWRHFTDEVQIPERRDPTQSVPEYPKAGHYEYEAPTLQFFSDEGLLIASFYQQDDADGKYLLTSEENGEFRESGDVPECALRRVE